MNAGEYFFKIRAAGGGFTMGLRGELKEVSGPSALLAQLETVNVEDLAAVVREHAEDGAIIAAEQLLAPIAQKQIDAFESKALAALCAYATRGRTCTPSLPMLTRDLELPAGELVKVRAALGELEAKGFITIERRPNTSNRYTILTPLQGASEPRVKRKHAAEYQES